MIRNIQIFKILLILAFVQAAPITSHSSTMKVDKNGELLVKDEGFLRKSLKCKKQWVEVVYGGTLTAKTGYTIEYANLGNENPQLLDITSRVANFIGDTHDLSSLELKCLPSEEKVGIFIPSNDDEISQIYIMIMKDGRVMNGYNLSGHDITATIE